MAVEDAVLAEIHDLEAQQKKLTERLGQLRQVAQILKLEIYLKAKIPPIGGVCLKAQGDGTCVHVGRHMFSERKSNVVALP